ncbi:hypothetical protein SBRCBS47491_001642 [Sporothrix bragantina]|uniref:Major facilitator superfamily (MFS) profile domain-containing protein n=1 Tax=Sporothrix bragantina TaxID=671064 RepID=A0ABP0B087_9PEZI
MSMTATQTQQKGISLSTIDNNLPETRSQYDTVTATTSTGTQAAHRATQIKMISAGFSFFVAGINDGSIGTLVPYLIQDYGINTAIASSVYGANFMGWFVAALSNTHLCQYLSLGSMLFLGAALQVLAPALRAWRPPFPLFVASFLFSSLGQAYQDTHGNTFVAGGARPETAHRWLAFIHAMYAAGMFCGPFVSTAVASADTRWYLFYYFPLGLGIFNVCLVAFAFRDMIALKRPVPAAAVPGSLSAREQVKTALKNKSVWLLSLFYFFFLGASVTASGWTVDYLVVVRDGDISKMGYVQAGFSGGALLGRLLLAEPTHRFGTRKMVSIYTIAAIGLQLLFWL